MDDLTAWIQNTLVSAPIEGLDIDSLERCVTGVLQTTLFQQLLALWKQGHVFASKVRYERSGYVPTRDAKWTTSKIEGYFGYHPSYGLYRIQSGWSQCRLQLLATLHVGAPVYSVAVAPDGDKFVVGLYSGEIVIGNLSTASIYKRVPAHTERVWALDISPDGELFASGSQDGRIIVWDWSGEKCVVTDKLEDWVTCVCFSPDARRLISGHKIVNPASAAIRIWEVASGRQIDVLTHHEIGKSVYAVSVLPNGRGLVSGGSDQNVAYYSFDKAQIVFKSSKHAGTVTALAVHPSSRQVTSGAWTGTLKLWDLETGEVLKTIEAHNTRITALAYSPSGRLLASGSRDTKIAIWWMPEGYLMANIDAHAGWVRTVAWGKDDHVLVSGGSEGCCRIWELRPVF